MNICLIILVTTEDWRADDNAAGTAGTVDASAWYVEEEAANDPNGPTEGSRQPPSQNASLTTTRGRGRKQRDVREIVNT
jgi:hypothetical protein